MLDYNIEFAHIYINEAFSNEQLNSIYEANRVTTRLIKRKEKFATVILIDNYNTVEKLLNTKDLVKKIEDIANFPLDFIVYEADLVEHKDFLLSKMDNKKKKSYQKYFNKNGRIPCSFLCAIWYLKRLGFIPLGKIDFEPKKFVAREIINILPGKFQEVEKKAMEIIKASKFSESVNRIKYNFF